MAWNPTTTREVQDDLVTISVWQNQTHAIAGPFDLLKIVFVTKIVQNITFASIHLSPLVLLIHKKGEFCRIIFAYLWFC